MQGIEDPDCVEEGLPTSQLWRNRTCIRVGSLFTD